jgi:phosphatidyl-myo-inositol dimannoside synthase
MKRTLLITLEYPPMVGGIAHYYKNLVQGLPPGSIWVLDNHGGELLSSSPLVWPHWLKGLLNSYRAVRKYSIEHILVGQVLPIGTIALILKLFFRIRYTVMTHAMDVTIPFGNQGSARKRWLVRKILQHADHVTTVSVYTRIHLDTLGVNPKKIAMIYPCPNVSGLDQQETHTIDRVAFDAEHHLEEKRVLLTVTRLVERKGIDVALQAFSRLANKYADVEYIILGDGPDRPRLEQLALQMGVKDRVRFVGKVSESLLAQWYERCDVFVMPSRKLSNNDVEGFGIVFVEANSFGKPVIAGKSGGVSDAVIDGETGFLVDPMDIGMVAKAMDRLLSDPEQARMLGEQGRERVREFFQWTIQAKTLEKILS